MWKSSNVIVMAESVNNTVALSISCRAYTVSTSKFDDGKI